MKKTRKLIMVLLALTVAVSLCACGGGNGEKVQKEASGNEISGNSPADSSVDGENDIYLFDYELTFDFRTDTDGVMISGIIFCPSPRVGKGRDTDGVMISGIKDETTKNMTFPQTRVSKYNDPMPVLGIYEWAFRDNTVIENVIIPDFCYQIQNSAFSGCTNLSGVEIGSGVWLIGNSAFYGCSSLKSARLPDALDTLGSAAFQACTSLESITVPEKVTVLDETLFSGCGALKSVSLPSGITEIKLYAFAGCSSLETITFAGTTAQWEAIIKDSEWSPDEHPFEVACSDGTLQIDGSGSIAS